MDKEPDVPSSGLSLYLAADQKIDQVKEQIRELFQREQANQEKIDKLRERLEMGVGRTSRATADKVSDIILQVNGLAHQMAVAETSLQHHERLLGRITSGIFLFSFTGLLGSLLSVAYQILKIKLFGQ